MNGYLPLPDAGAYCGKKGKPESCARWARRHLVPHLPTFQLPGSGPLLKKSDIDALLERHRREPVDVAAIVAAVMPKRYPARGTRGRFQRKGEAA